MVAVFRKGSETQHKLLWAGIQAVIPNIWYWTSLLKAEAGKSPNVQDLARHYIVLGARTS